MAKILVFFLLVLGLVASSTSVVLPKDLGNACQNIWNAAGNNLKVPLELSVNAAPGANPVFTVLGDGNLKVRGSDVFHKFKAFLTNPTLQTKNEFLAITVLQPEGPVEKALDYLIAQKILPNTETLQTFLNVLEDMWFSPLPGHPFGKGFPHVFTGEETSYYDKKKKATVNAYSGFHNWYRFYLEQSKGVVSNVAPSGFTPNTTPSFIRLGFDWNGRPKSSINPSSLFVGTSPAFDFALYSVCFLSLYKPVGGVGTKECTCKINTSTLLLRAIEKPTAPGKICTIFPVSVV